MKPIFRIFLIIIISFAFCQMMFVLSQRGLKAYSCHKYERLNELLHNKSSYDLVLIGSSIVHCGMDPRIIDSICNLSSYNAGVEGGNLLEVKMILDAYLVNHPAPKYLVLTLDFASFNLNRKFFNHLDYYPFLSNEVVDRVLSNNGHKTSLLKVFPFIELTEYDEEMRSKCVKGLIGKSEIMSDQIAYKGFLSRPMNIHNIDSNIQEYFGKANISDESLKLFQSISDTCHSRNVKLIINFPPVYSTKAQRVVVDNGKIFKTIYNLASEYKLHFLDDDKFDFCTDSSFFSDVTHLNKTGAEVYSTILGKELAGIINKTE